MLEPDIALTDFLLAALCTGFAASLLRRHDMDSGLRWPFAALFAALALASLLGGVWHGFLSGPGAPEVPIVWTTTMLALGGAASALWVISARIASSPGWRRWLSVIAFVQFVAFAGVVLSGTQSYGIVGPAMLPPLAVLMALIAMTYRKSGSPRLLLAIAGLLLVVGANVLQRFDVSLPALGLSADAFYHVLQAVAFVLVFMAVPSLKAGGTR